LTPIAGSSPRVRGTASIPFRSSLPRRFIPACAGNRSGAKRKSPVRSVHPRVCGEQFGVVCSTCFPAGSSPRVRGTGVTAQNPNCDWRFIPACAGNSHQPDPTPSHAAVHPRVCGEQSATRPATCSAIGSSPRVRGTARAARAALGVGRFIPACAGNSRCRARPAPRNAVHPRVCGEQRQFHRRLRW